MIQPTIGRKVWYFPQGNSGAIVHDATIVAVWSDQAVNLACHDENGASYPVRSAVLLADDISDEGRAAYYSTPHAEWMPYQAGQAKAQAAAATSSAS